MSTALIPALPANLPSIANAKLPAIYQSAKETIAACEQIDECKDWADKSEALASYAKQAGDETLRKTADRIQARAIRRCGELLREIKPARGANQNIRDAADPKVRTREGAAADAGLSERQRKTALRVAAVPAPEFEAAVEGPEPPTVTALAEKGKAPRPLVDLGGRDPEEFKASTRAQGALRVLAEVAREVPAAVAARGALNNEHDELREQAGVVLTWLEDLLDELKETP